MLLKILKYFASRLSLAAFALSLIIPLPSHALTQIALEWLPNPEPLLAGYRLYSRYEGELYDYSNPVWEGDENTCVIDIKEEETACYFVIRAYDIYENESGNSNEVCFGCGDDSEEPGESEEIEDEDRSLNDSSDSENDAKTDYQGCFIDFL